MGRTRDVTIALAGAALIASAAFGLFAVESRAGPHTLSVAPVEYVFDLEGTYRTTGASGDMVAPGVCVPQPPATECRAPETEVRLRVAGLPVVADVHYAAFLMGTEPIDLGLLEPTDGAHTLHVVLPYETRNASRLLAAVHLDAVASAPSDLTLFDEPLPAAPDDQEVEFGGSRTARPATGTGTVRLNEIGGMTVSTVARATLRDVQVLPSWGLHARLEARDGPGTTTLGALVPDEQGVFVLDARVERVRLEDQDRFVVTLAAQGGEPAPGFVLYASEVPPAA